MAGYFELVGKIVTEKGSWYKIAFLLFLQVILMIFQPQVLVARSATSSAPNIAGWILFFLSSGLVTGFFIQVYANRIKTDKTIFPKFDIADMLFKAVRIIPLNLVWTIYYLLYFVLIAFAIYSSMTSASGFSKILTVLLVVPMLLLIYFAYPVLLAIHTKSFKYSGLLNPLVIFDIFARTGLPMFLNGLAFAVSCIVISVLCYALAFVLGFSSVSAISEGLVGLSIPLMLGIILILVLFFYFIYVFQLAFIARTCDIAKEYFADSDLMYSEYYDLEDDESSPSQIADEELFAGYMRNASEENGDGIIEMQTPFDKDDFRF